MKNSLLKNIILIILILTFTGASGCIFPSTNQSANAPTPTPVKENPNLDAKIVSLSFDRTYYNAGEPVIATLTLANTGKIDLTSERIVINATVLSLDDFLANMYLKTMSEEEKSKSSIIDFEEKIPSEKVKSLTARFKTIREMKGRNLAGQYLVTVTLYVNDQWADSREITLTLHSGTPVESTPTPEITETPVMTPEITPTPTMQTPTPTITPTPKPNLTPVITPVIAVTPTGIIKEVRIMNSRFAITNLSIKPGDAVFWNNYDDSLVIIESRENFPFHNLTLQGLKRSENIVFNRSGAYHYNLYNQFKKNLNSQLTIKVG